MPLLQSLMKVHENQEGLKPNMTYQLVRCANRNKHGIPITRQMSGIESKETSAQTCSISWILWLTQCVADDYVLLRHDSESMPNGIPAIREIVGSSSSRVETSYIFNIRTQNPLDLHNFDTTLKLPSRRNSSQTSTCLVPILWVLWSNSWTGYDIWGPIP